ncbi:helix-turn-helix domain-containing protein [Providencia rettgeri]
MKRKISKSVGLKIRSLREIHGMSGKELSMLLGISQQHQSRYENGEVNIHVDTIYQLAKYLMFRRPISLLKLLRILIVQISLLIKRIISLLKLWYSNL